MTCAWDESRKKVLAGRGIAIAIGCGLFAFPYVPAVQAWGADSRLFDGYAHFLRWAGLAWLALAFGPWRELAPKVAFWPGADPHNLYGGAAVLLAIAGAGALIYGIAFPLLLIAFILGAYDALTPTLATGFGLSFGVWAIRRSRRLQELALEHDRATAA